MRAGLLRHQIQIQVATVSRNSFGEAVVGYETYATVRANVTPVLARELAYAQEVYAETQYKISLRYNADIKATDRVVYDGRTFLIGGVINSFERDRESVLYCKEIV